MKEAPEPRDRPVAEPSPSREATIDLLDRYRSGDPRALDILLTRNLAPLRRWAAGRMPRGARDRADTEDLVQETILKALPHLERIEYRGEGAVQAYLRGALMNRMRNEYRRAAARPRAKTVDTAIEHRGPSPLEEVIGRDAADDYERAMAALEEGDRELVILRLELGYAFAEIAAATGRPSPDAARMATSRAILRLAQRMRHGQEHPGPRPDPYPRS